MPCQAMYTWTLSGLVSAFVDLSIAYLLFCASAIVFMASKFLGAFGLFLPCPCDGLFFAQPNRNLCFQKLLIDYPTEKVSNVQLSIRSKFPFDDSMWGNDQNCNVNLRLIDEREREMIEFEGEASCSSVSGARKSSNIHRIRGELNARNEVGAMRLLGTRERRFDMKGKEIMHQRPRTGLRRRRKGGFDHGKYSSIASYDPRFSEVQGDPESPSSTNKGGNELAEDDIMVIDNEIDSHHDHKEAPAAMRLGQRLSNSIELNELCGEDEQIEENRELSGHGEVGQNRDDKSTIRLLERALEEEHDARTALYLELEKERSAAATAADEAMAMIQRLQEEKASIEMEARQNQRIIEEKSAYVAEEMNILKEIIIRREREKHFLEKEVEAYRQMINVEIEQPTVNTEDILDGHTFVSSLDPNEDPVLMLQELSTSIDEKNGSVGAPKESSFQGWGENAEQGHPSGYLPQFSVCSNDRSQELWDKMVPIDKNSRSPPGDTASVETGPWSCKVVSYPEKFSEENISLSSKGEEHMNRHAEMLESNVETSHIPSHYLSLQPSGKDTNQETKSSCNSSDKDPLVHDVHVIVNQSNSCNPVNRSKEEWNLESSTLGIHMTKDVSSEASVVQRVSAICDTPNSSNLVPEVGTKRNNSETTSRLPPVGPKGKLQYSDLRRNSLSAVANERLKIDGEIGWLRESLRTLQEGREKLNLSVEHQEREKLQLKLLKDIAHQLQEIQQLAEPGKAVRQASLPLPSSKVISKKRRSRSVSLGQLASS